MRLTRLCALAPVLAAFMLFVLPWRSALDGQAGDAVTGVVRSAKDGAMEGVLVTVRRAGTPVAVTVVSDDDGAFRFPRSHITPGRYDVSIRAAGYDLQAPAAVEVDAGRTATLRLDLSPARDVAAQLSSLEWVMSMPGTKQEKDRFVRHAVNCGFCHTLERVAKSRYSAEQWVPVIERMGSYNPDKTGSSQGHRIGAPGSEPLVRRAGWGWNTLNPQDNVPVKELAGYLARVNRGQSEGWSYQLQTLPRPTGQATRAIVTVYDIPRERSSIHDLDVDAHGNVWYGNSEWDYLGKLDPRTGMFSEYAVPSAGEAASGKGIQDVQVDPENNVWAAVEGSRFAKFDPKSSRWTFFDIPAKGRVTFIAPFHRHTKTFWANMVGAKFVYRLDIPTGRVDTFNVFDQAPPGSHGVYMTDRDADDNVYGTDYGGSTIVRLDGKTGAVKLYPTPTPHAYPRRGAVDANGRFWFSEFLTDKVGVLDPRTERIREFDMPRTYISPYFARPAANGDVWISSNGSDRVLRLSPDTGKVLEYLLPVYYDARKMVIDRSASRLTLWIPNKNLAQLVRVEALD